MQQLRKCAAGVSLGYIKIENPKYLLVPIVDTSMVHGTIWCTVQVSPMMTLQGLVMCIGLGWGHKDTQDFIHVCCLVTVSKGISVAGTLPSEYDNFYVRESKCLSCLPINAQVWLLTQLQNIPVPNPQKPCLLAKLHLLDWHGDHNVLWSIPNQLSTTEDLVMNSKLPTFFPKTINVPQQNMANILLYRDRKIMYSSMSVVCLTLERVSLSHSIANPFLFHVFLKPWIMGSFSQTLWFAKGQGHPTTPNVLQIALRWRWRLPCPTVVLP